jgi:TusA-related sulfurtransferase
MSDATAREGVHIILDTYGLLCPVPVIRLAKAIEQVPLGATIEVLSDDEGAKADIPAWCRLKSQEFVGLADRPRGWAFTVRRVR